MIVGSPYKIYVDVDTLITKDGELIPKSIHWNDDTIYEIQKITDIRRAANLAAGASGVRYTIYVDGYESHLYYGDDCKWFVEGKKEQGNYYKNGNSN